MCWLRKAVSSSQHMCTGSIPLRLEKFNGLNGAATQWWILQCLHHKPVLVGSGDLHNRFRRLVLNTNMSTRNIQLQA
jgi:hypothetical protein